MSAITLCFLLLRNQSFDAILLYTYLYGPFYGFESYDL